MIKRIFTVSSFIIATLTAHATFAYVEMGNAYVMGSALYCSGMAPCFSDFNNGCQQFQSGTKYKIYNVDGKGGWTEYIIYSEHDDAINENNRKSQQQGFNEGSSFTVEPVSAVAH
ncbi:hypothetical protein [Edaphocola aurantiacus]|uniref:hypothetical protein n=1 Tax=Edaphocola aurantiacus TaxID=2601682 RepID=UPI001C94324A|nr:hypothetical protein [Edaphocola aurantiacus]